MSVEATFARRWLADNDLRRARNMSLDDVLTRSAALHKKASREFDGRTIMAFGLDNPYAQDHAIRTLAGEARRYGRERVYQ